MLGYELFLKKIEMLDFGEQCDVLRKIFKIDVLCFDINLINENIYIKIYDGYIYYQIVFVISNSNDECLNIDVSDRIVVCYIFVNNISKNLSLFDDVFIQFINFLISGDDERG